MSRQFVADHTKFHMQLETARKEIQNMIDMDVLEPLECPFASSIITANKSDESNRIRGQFHKTVYDLAQG